MDIKQDNFKRISTSRKEKIINLFRQLGNLQNGSFYEFTDEEIYELFDEIEVACAEAKNLLLKKNKNRRNERQKF